MQPLIPRKQTSLGSGQAIAGRLELVESWKLRVRSRLERQAELSGAPRVKVHVDIKLAVFAAALGLAGGLFGAIRSLVLLLTILLAHEFSRAALARCLGRSARVSISLAGGQTEISQPELRGPAALGFAMVGSLANLGLALGLQATSHHLHDPRWALALRELGTGHAIWGLAQALPLLPFRAGAELARRLPAPLRSMHAIASGGLAIGAVFAIFNLPKSPLLIVALLLVAIASARAAHEAFQEEHDRQNGVAGKLAEARAALEAGDSARSVEITRKTLGIARSKQQRQKLWSTFAWAGVGSRNAFVAHAGLQQLPEECMDVHLLAAYLCCCGRAFEAQQLLEEARGLRQWSAETSKLLIEILFAQGDRAAALALTEADAAILSESDRRAVLLALAAAEGTNA